MSAIPDMKDRVDNAPLWTPGSRRTARPTRIIRSMSIKNLMGAARASYLVKGVLPDKGVAAIYGPSASGKTFLTLDVALAIARGESWFGHRVKQAGVIYIAAEGESGISDRLRAALGSEPADMPLEVIPAPVDLLRGEDHLNALTAAIRLAEKRIGRVGLIVIDTLARCMPGGDENSSQDMGSVLQNIDRLRRAIDGLVLIVHHTGKNQAAGARGHSSFFSAMDSCIEVSRDGDSRSFRVAKSRESVDGDEQAFRLNVVELGEDEDGDQLTSCVIEASDGASGWAPAQPKGVTQQLVFEAIKKQLVVSSHFGKGHSPVGRPCVLLDDAIQCAGEALTCEAKRRKPLARRAIESMMTRGIYVLSDGWLWVK
jgi:putative DNA primase/helicase